MHADFLLAAKIVAAWIISENMPVISFTTKVRFSTASTCQSVLVMVSWILFCCCFCCLLFFVVVLFVVVCFLFFVFFWGGKLRI